MSISYSFYLRVGFEIPTQDLKKAFKHQKVSHEDGVFHMEDRFDPKTGAKIEPTKVWDKKPKTQTDTWWEIDGERFEDWEDETMTQVFEEKLGCHVDAYWRAGGAPDVGWSYGFYLHDPNNKDKMGDGNRFTIHNISMNYQEVYDMEFKLNQLKTKITAMGLKPGDAKVFLGEVSG